MNTTDKNPKSIKGKKNLPDNLAELFTLQWNPISICKHAIWAFVMNTISFYDLSMTILSNGIDNSKQKNKGRKMKKRVHGIGKHNSWAGTEEMIQQFPIPTWQLTTLQVSITVVSKNPTPSLASLDTSIYIVHRHTWKQKLIQIK